MLPNAEELVRIILSTIVPIANSDGVGVVPEGNLRNPITTENYVNLTNSENLFLTRSIFIDSEFSIESGVFHSWINRSSEGRATGIDYPLFRIYQFIAPADKNKIVNKSQEVVPAVAVYSHLGHDQDSAFGGISIREIYRVEFFGRPYQSAHRAYLLARLAFLNHPRVTIIQGNIDDYESDVRIWRKFLTISVR